jgi:hypothetical protein
VSALEATGAGLIAALEQTGADIRRPPKLPEVVVVTGSGLSSGAFHNTIPDRSPAASAARTSNSRTSAASNRWRAIRLAGSSRGVEASSARHRTSRQRPTPRATSV